MGLTSGGWAGKGLQTGAGPQRPTLTGVLLGGAATAESIGRAVISDGSLSNVPVLCLLGLAGTLPLTFLPPAAAAASISAVTVLSLVGFHTLTVAVLCATLIVFHRLGRRGPRHGGALMLTPVAAVSFLALALFSHPEREVEILTVVLASLSPAAAWAGSAQRAHIDAEQHGAARQAIMGRLMEHTARGERARIARELHDVVAHHISVIAVQAETARLTTPGMPAAGAQRLSEIGDAARAALTEMRRLLGVLREDTAIEDTEDRHPQPSLRQLNELLDDVRNAHGAGTRLIMRGRPVTLDSGIELAAFRIVQEALTNARRHAPGAAVDVELVYTKEALLLRIRDNGPGPPAASSGAGHGLLGMRERAAAVGGRLSSGSAPSGGFLIEASLPARVEQSPLSTVDTVNVETGSVR
ncbi:sensor histidine kinase [Streptomyces phyllanthi]|uniref:histidine kinase n=1 Tax=Streptomyces phyllanthi TaxID=1803180 RepID=A0A5N8VY23_9ACTN|nr:sensor histidine kinase [Streptomyces phyllanthi]MPY39606.1 sensor histidine kinase [Streptomyces phyllanthi]